MIVKLYYWCTTSIVNNFTALETRKFQSKTTTAHCKPSMGAMNVKQQIKIQIIPHNQKFNLMHSKQLNHAN